jgi:hypothetical protein
MAQCWRRLSRRTRAACSKTLWGKQYLICSGELRRSVRPKRGERIAVNAAQAPEPILHNGSSSCVSAIATSGFFVEDARRKSRLDRGAPRQNKPTARRRRPTSFHRLCRRDVHRPQRRRRRSGGYGAARPGASSTVKGARSRARPFCVIGLLLPIAPVPLREVFAAVCGRHYNDVRSLGPTYDSRIGNTIQWSKLRALSARGMGSSGGQAPIRLHAFLFAVRRTGRSRCGGRSHPQGYLHASRI